MFLFTWQSMFRVSDAGMNVLLLFISIFFGLLVSTLGLRCLTDFINLLPQSVSSARKLIGHVSDRFTKYASWPQCHSIYPLASCKVKLPDGSESSRMCSYIQFPQHPHSSRRSPCAAQLMKKVRTSASTTMLYPRQLYCIFSRQPKGDGWTSRIY